MKQPLLSLTKDNFQWDYFRGSGKGGQKRNKTESAVRCTHVESGVSYYSDETRSQHKNKILAFKKVVNDKKFQTWLKIQSCKQYGIGLDMEKKIEDMMQERNLKIEYYTPV